MRVLVTGDRYWKDGAVIRRVLLAMDVDMLIVGDATGADALAIKAAEALGVPYERYEADWVRFRRGAGPRRNRQMLTEGKPDVVLAFHNNLNESSGTKNCVEQAAKLGIPWVNFRSKAERREEGENDD